MNNTDNVVGHISESEPWGMSTDVQSLTEYLGQSARVALSDLYVQIWTAKSADELTALTEIHEELATLLRVSLSTADALKSQLQRDEQKREKPCRPSGGEHRPT